MSFIDTLYYVSPLFAVFSSTLLMLVQLVTLCSTLKFSILPFASNTEWLESARARSLFFLRSKTASIWRKFDSDCDAIENELSRRENLLFSLQKKKKQKTEKILRFKTPRRTQIRLKPRNLLDRFHRFFSLILLAQN